MVHDDFDFRTPLHRITCPHLRRAIRQGTCADPARRPLANTTGQGAIARHTRLVAEAYTRLAEIEETLDLDALKTRPA